MRIAAAVLGSLIALAIVESGAASPQFAATFELSYSSTRPGSPAGLDALATWSDPGDPVGKPKELQRIKLTFHPGARLDPTALPRCRASDREVQLTVLAACPRSTLLGSVLGRGVISTGAPFDPVATLFNAPRAMIVVVTINGRMLVNFRDDVRRRSITINFKIPKGVSLVSFDPHIPPHVRKRGKLRKTYFRTPRRCPASGFWTTEAIFTYRDGSSQQLSDETPCQPK